MVDYFDYIDTQIILRRRIEGRFLYRTAFTSHGFRKRDP